MLTITDMNKCFMLEYGGQKLICLNVKALRYQLKFTFGMKAERVSMVLGMFETHRTITLDLRKSKAA